MVRNLILNFRIETSDFKGGVIALILPQVCTFKRSICGIDFLCARNNGKQRNCRCVGFDFRRSITPNQQVFEVKVKPVNDRDFSQIFHLPGVLKD